MDLTAVATWVGLEPAPDRMRRLRWATPFITASTQALAAADGLAEDEVPVAAARDLPVRYEVVAPGPVAATRPCELGVLEAALAIRAGELSPVELLRSCLEMIDRTERAVHAFVRFTTQAARGQVALTGSTPPTGVLYGIPFAVKDLIDTGNVRAERGSPAFAGRTPAWDATVVSRIRAAGGILVGKTATHEIAYGVSTPQSRNPWDTSRMTSGSSGGSAAALAARQVPMALGTDTGGSLRLPSAFCGTTAIRPTFGVVPRSGVQALAPSFDVVGPMARSAWDCMLLLRVLTGDVPTEPVVPVVDLAHVRIGFVPEIAMPEHLVAAMALRDLGAQLVEITLPPLSLTQAAGSVLAFAEAAAEFRAEVVAGEPFAEDIQALLEAGLTVPVADFLHAQRVRAAIRRDYAELLGRVDAIMLPTAPLTDLPHGISEHEGVPLIAVLTPYTVPASLTGLPAIAFPCGFTASGMPVGAQLMGAAHTEPLLAAITGAYQQATDWHTRIPPVALGV